MSAFGQQPLMATPVRRVEALQVTRLVARDRSLEELESEVPPAAGQLAGCAITSAAIPGSAAFKSARL
jgi:hypothetical protein